MQRSNHIACVVVGLGLVFSSCQPQVDVDKEKAAIKAVIEAEKKGYFNKSLEEMAATWVQKSSSVKIFMSQKGEFDLFGWSKINDFSKEELVRIDSAYRNMNVEFSDYQFNIYETNAWAIFKSRWNWTYRGEQQQLEQTRIMAFEKAEGKWKITLMAIYDLPSEKREAQKKEEKAAK